MTVILPTSLPKGWIWASTAIAICHIMFASILRQYAYFYDLKKYETEQKQEKQILPMTLTSEARQFSCLVHVATNCQLGKVQGPGNYCSLTSMHGTTWWYKPHLWSLINVTALPHQASNNMFERLREASTNSWREILCNIILTLELSYFPGKGKVRKWRVMTSPEHFLFPPLCSTY